jgi:protein TonB
VTFVVSKDGSVKNVKVVRGVDPILDKEAIRVISGQPRWTPGEHRGKKVNVSYTVPINFVLQ